MAKIIINSADSFDEKISQKMIAQKTIENDITIFKYNNKYGQGEIRISPHSTQILKTGEIQSNLILKPNSTTDFIYRTTHFNKDFTVVCKKYDYSENKLTINYIIYDNSVEVNNLEIEIIEVQ